MSCNRRTFIRNGSLLALGSMVSPSVLFASSEFNIRPAKPLAMRSAESAVMEFIARYSSRQCLVGATVLAKLRGNEPATPSLTRVLAEITDPQKLLGVFSFGPFGNSGVAGAPPSTANATAEGNLVKFQFQEVGFVLENLLVKEFSDRLSDLKNAPVFAHDALAYDPATRKLRDPFKASIGAEIKLVTAPATGAAGHAAALDAVLRGFIEAREVGLVEGPEFTAWSERVLALRGGHALTLARILEARMPSLAAYEEEKAALVLRSNLVGHVLQTEGVPASGSYERFLGANVGCARLMA